LRLQPDSSAAGFAHHASAIGNLTMPLTGSLAIAAITATALSLFHPLDATVMILLWNLGTAVIFIGLAGAFRRRMFSWVARHVM
jgi:hypothetical protein